MGSENRKIARKIGKTKNPKIQGFLLLWLTLGEKLVEKSIKPKKKDDENNTSNRKTAQAIS